jgi:hypothetical protein
MNIPDDLIVSLVAIQSTLELQFGSGLNPEVLIRMYNAMLGIAARKFALLFSFLSAASGVHKTQNTPINIKCWRRLKDTVIMNINIVGTQELQVYENRNISAI